MGLDILDSKKILKSSRTSICSIMHIPNEDLKHHNLFAKCLV